MAALRLVVLRPGRGAYCGAANRRPVRFLPHSRADIRRPRSQAVDFTFPFKSERPSGLPGVSCFVTGHSVREDPVEAAHPPSLLCGPRQNRTAGAQQRTLGRRPHYSPCGWRGRGWRCSACTSPVTRPRSRRCTTALLPARPWDGSGARRLASPFSSPYSHADRVPCTLASGRRGRFFPCLKVGSPRPTLR